MAVVPPGPQRAESQTIKDVAGGGWMKALKPGAKPRIAERIAAIADKTATMPAVPAPKDGPVQAPAAAPETPLPQSAGATAKLTERARPERLKQDYNRYLFWLHEYVLDAPNESLFFVPTKTPAALDALTINSINRAYGNDYRPTPCRLFDWLLAAIDYDLGKLTFVDHGAGKGRVLLLASEHPFQAVGGIEFAEELHDDAIMNIRQYPRSRMKCRNVECVLEDASQVGPPDGETVHYFFNPFAREVFAEVLNNIVASYRQRPRRLYLILVDPPAVADLIDASGVFTKLELPRAERLKVKLFSPYDVALYRTLA